MSFTFYVINQKKKRSPIHFPGSIEGDWNWNLKTKKKLFWFFRFNPNWITSSSSHHFRRGLRWSETSKKKKDREINRNVVLESQSSDNKKAPKIKKKRRVGWRVKSPLKKKQKKKEYLAARWRHNRFICMADPPKHQFKGKKKIKKREIHQRKERILFLP